MKNNRVVYRLLFAVLMMLLLLNCKKHDALPVATFPIVTTNTVKTNAGVVILTMGGVVISDGGSVVTEKGVCLSTLENPTLADTHYACGSGEGVFDVNVEIRGGITHYVKAYATNKVGTAYGNQVTAIRPPYLPMVSTSIILTKNSTSAIAGGIVVFTGGATEIFHGFCWSTSHAPTVADNKTTANLGVGFFTGTITGLSPNAIYYVRAYATNSTGTSYGEEIPFVLEQYNLPTVTDIDGNMYHTITIGTQVWMVENLRTTKFRNGDPIPKNTVELGMSKELHGYSDYNNDPNYSAIYGRLYDWYIVSDSRKIAPEGWHVPSDTEWTTLTDFLTNNGYGYGGSGNDIAKSMASKSGWTSFSLSGRVGNDQQSNNSSGFAGLPGGALFYISNGGGINLPVGFYFMDIGYTGHWWSSAAPSLIGSSRRMGYEGNTLESSGSLDVDGYSVRCIKD